MITKQCATKSARDIAQAIGLLVSRGDLTPGDQLPTVRTLARELEVSSSTVADAWRLLSHHGVIDTARRNGTTIRAARADMTGRFWRVPAAASGSIIDLSTGTPDVDLLPSLTNIVRELPAELAVTSYIDRPVLSDLEAVLHDRWPFPAAGMTVVDGALDAIDRLINALVSFGDTVLVEDPTFPPILDMLERAGANIVAAGLDAEGLIVDELVTALSHSPVLAVLQPIAHNPTGISMSASRLRDIAAAFAEHAPDTWIVEDHHAGDLIVGGDATLGAFMPERVVRVHSFSKSHGPDLRIAAVGGAAGPIDEVVDRRRLGPSWTSRLVQQMLLTLLTDPKTIDIVAAASDVYDGRRQRIISGLAEHGVEVGSAAGLNLWVPVANEQRALVALALNGIGLAAGSPFRLDNRHVDDHLRLSVGNARTDLERIISEVATAAAS